MSRALVKILCCLLVTQAASDDNLDDDELTEDELGTVAEDLTEYSWQAGLRWMFIRIIEGVKFKTRLVKKVQVVAEWGNHKIYICIAY